MLNKIISFSLRNRLAVLLGAALLVIAGLYTARTMEVDVFPDLNAPTVVGMAEAKGMAPEGVERRGGRKARALFLHHRFLYRVGRVRLGHGDLSGTADRGGENRPRKRTVAR